MKWNDYSCFPLSFGIGSDIVRVKLRATRIAQQMQREEAALRQVQSVIEEMEQLKESLNAAVSSLFLGALFLENVTKHENSMVIAGHTLNVYILVITVSTFHFVCIILAS